MHDFVNQLHPWALIGAAFGCAFYTLDPAGLPLGRRAGYGLVSLGLGYAAGVYWYGDGPPWAQQAMGPAALAAALAVVTLAAFSGAISGGTGIPPVLSDILDRIPGLNRREPPK